MEVLSLSLPFHTFMRAPKPALEPCQAAGQSGLGMQHPPNPTHTHTTEKPSPLDYFYCAHGPSARPFPYSFARRAVVGMR